MTQLNIGTWVFDPFLLDVDSVVYSFGVGRDVDFEMGLINRFDMEVFIFDPTPGVEEFLNSVKHLSLKLKFFDYGIAERDKLCSFYRRGFPNYSLIATEEGPRGIERQFFRLITIMEARGHEKLDLLKLDIEGTEYGVLADMLDCKIYPKQLLVEFHEERAHKSWEETEALCQDLFDVGYRVFNDREEKFNPHLFNHWSLVYENSNIVKC